MSGALFEGRKIWSLQPRTENYGDLEVKSSVSTMNQLEQKMGKNFWVGGRKEVEN